jgi:hypothetical protein
LDPTPSEPWQQHGFQPEALAHGGGLNAQQVQERGAKKCF